MMVKILLSDSDFADIRKRIEKRKILKTSSIAIDETIEILRDHISYKFNEELEKTTDMIAEKIKPYLDEIGTEEKWKNE